MEVISKRIGLIVAHLGTAFLILGIGIVSTFSIEREVVLSEGEEYQLGDTIFHFKNITQLEGPNYFSKVASINVKKRNSTFEINAEKRN